MTGPLGQLFIFKNCTSLNYYLPAWDKTVGMASWCVTVQLLPEALKFLITDERPK